MFKRPIDPEPGALDLLRAASLSTTPVSLGHRRTSSPHEYYRYPARFSPEFAAAAVDAFSEPGDLILDPFVGGGTTLVEARLLGRRAIGADLNALATFVSQAKARCYSRSDVDVVRRWAPRAVGAVCLSAPEPDLGEWQDNGYLVHLSTPQTWRLRKVIAQLLVSVDRLPAAAAMLARCALLRTSQWALDMRSKIPTPSQFLAVLVQNAVGMADAADGYRTAVARADRSVPAEGKKRTVILQEGLPGLSLRMADKGLRSPQLVVTSPP